jgi:hypothetical protein
MSAIILTPLAGRKQMKRVPKGSVKVMKRGRNKFHDPYLAKCVKAVSNTCDIVATQRAVPNTIANKNRVRARIMSVAGNKIVGVNWYTEGKLVVPVITKK